MEPSLSDLDKHVAPVSDPLHWLVALCEHLVPAFEIVNGRGDPVLPPLAGAAATRLRRTLEAPERSVEIRAVLEAAARHPSVVFSEVGELRLAAIALRTAVHEDLTLVLAEPVRTISPPSADGLARVGGWLAAAVRHSSLQTTDPFRLWRELFLLSRILAGAAATGHDERVVQALVDALAVWADTDTRAYTLTRSGAYLMEVALAGAAPERAPRVINGRHLPSVFGLVRLTPADASRLGFDPRVDVIVETVRDEGAAPWLLAHLGSFSEHDEERLALFSELLLPAVHAARGVEVSRLVWALTQELAGDWLTAGDGVTAALRQLDHVMQASVSLTVRQPDGARIVELASAPSPSRPRATLTPALRLPLALSTPYHAALLVVRSDDCPFTVREQRLAESGAKVLASWLDTVLRRGDFDLSRGTTSPVDASIDRRGQRTGTRPDDVSLLVIRPEATHSTAEVRDVWVGGIRRRLRPYDIAGALPSGEIGVLLPETGAADAQVVSARLRRVFEADAALYLLERAPIGVATSRGSGSGMPALLDQARGDARSGDPGGSS